MSVNMRKKSNSTSSHFVASALRLWFILINPLLMISLVLVAMYISVQETGVCIPLNHSTSVEVKFTSEKIVCDSLSSSSSTTSSSTSSNSDDYANIIEEVTSSPTADSNDPQSTNAPTLNPTPYPTVAGAPTTSGPTTAPTARTVSDIEAITGSSYTRGKDPYLASGNLVIQLDTGGTFGLYYEPLGLSISSDIQTCTLINVDSDEEITRECSIDTDGQVITVQVGTNITTLYPYSRWDLYADNTFVVSNLQFGVVFVCAGEESSALPIEHDLAADSFRSRYDSRIFHVRYGIATIASDPLPYGWSNSEESLEDASSSCYSFALNYLEEYPDTNFIGLVVISLPQISIGNWYPYEIDSLSDETGYEQGFHQLESSTVEALLVQYGNSFMTEDDVSDFQDKYYDYFFTNYWREAHPLSKIAIIGVDVQDINSAGLATKARLAFHDTVESLGDSLTTYVSVYDLPDPYYRTEGTITLRNASCSESSIASQPWFIKGWCENADDSTAFGKEKVGVPRLRGPVGYRAFRQLYMSEEPAQISSMTKISSDEIELVFDRAVAFLVPTPATENATSHPFRWSPLSSSSYYGFSDSSETIDSTYVSLSEDGLTLTIVRTDVSEDLSDTTLSQVFFGETNFPCCGDIVDPDIASTEDLVCVPMSCGLTLANNSYIPVAIFGTS